MLGRQELIKQFVEQVDDRTVYNLRSFSIYMLIASSITLLVLIVMFFISGAKVSFMGSGRNDFLYGTTASTFLFLFHIVLLPVSYMIHTIKSKQLFTRAFREIDFKDYTLSISDSLTLNNVLSTIYITRTATITGCVFLGFLSIFFGIWDTEIFDRPILWLNVITYFFLLGSLMNGYPSASSLGQLLNEYMSDTI